MDLFLGECFLDHVTTEVIKKAELIKKVEERGQRFGMS